MRTNGNRRHRVWLLLALAPMLLQAQPIYRCGHNAYGQTPCADGVVIDADDRRSPAQKAQTDAATAQAARQAERMRRERLAAERSASAATPRPVRDPHNSPAASTAAASRPASGPRPKSASRAKGPSGEAEPFTAWARSDTMARKKPAPAPSRD